MITDMVTKYIQNNNNYPYDVPYDIRTQLYFLGEEDDKWEYVKINGYKILNKLFLRSTSGLIYSMLSKQIIALEKGNNNLNIIGKQ